MDKILEPLESGQLLSNFTLEYLRQKGFPALYRFAQMEISFSILSERC
jgi:hypothetical protein